MAEAARDRGLRFGVSEHLWISYKWFSVSHGADETGPMAGVKYDGAIPNLRICITMPIAPRNGQAGLER